MEKCPDLHTKFFSQSRLIISSKKTTIASLNTSLLVYNGKFSDEMWLETQNKEGLTIFVANIY